jgi:hypothetical protein
VYVATYVRTYKHWFRLHAALQVLTTLLVTLGLGIIVYGKNQLGARHFATPHEVRSSSPPCPPGQRTIPPDPTPTTHTNTNTRTHIHRHTDTHILACVAARLPLIVPVALSEDACPSRRCRCWAL